MTIQLAIILGYLALLVFLGLFSTRLLRRTSGDYFLASRSIGPFMLLMSLFGTTMTSFALVGSTGEAFNKGIGVYGLMASWSAIIHSAVFFLVGIRVWAHGKRHGYLTQLAFFRDRYQSELLPLLLFPVVVGLVVIYILMGFVGAGAVALARRQCHPQNRRLARCCRASGPTAFPCARRHLQGARTQVTIARLGQGRAPLAGRSRFSPA